MLRRKGFDPDIAAQAAKRLHESCRLSAGEGRYLDVVTSPSLYKYSSSNRRASAFGVYVVPVASKVSLD